MDTTCPYCELPQGWDACPIHRDGVHPTTPTLPDQDTTHPTPTRSSSTQHQH
jgi:hypothetical protein